MYSFKLRFRGAPNFKFSAEGHGEQPAHTPIVGSATEAEASTWGRSAEVRNHSSSSFFRLDGSCDSCKSEEFVGDRGWEIGAQSTIRYDNEICPVTRT